MVWFNKQIEIKDILSLGQGTMGEYIGIEVEPISKDKSQITKIK